MLSTGTLDLGSDADAATLSLANAGDLSLDWAVAGDTGPFVWSALGGTLGPGAGVEVQVGIDRGALAEGPVAATVTVSSSGDGTAAVTTLASVGRAPVLSIVQAPSSLRCPSPVGSVVVDVTDESAIAGVELRWTGPGANGSMPMQPARAGWQARLTPERLDGAWTWEAVATDEWGNVGTISAPFVVSGCP